MSDRDYYDENIAEDAGYAAGRIEGAYDNAEDDLRREEQRVEDLPGEIADGAERRWDEGVQDVEDIPSDVGSAVEGVANWIGEKIGSVEGHAERAEQDVKDRYYEEKQDVEDFRDDVRDSYEDGKEEGRDGSW